MLLEVGKLYRSRIDTKGSWNELTKLFGDGYFLVAEAKEGANEDQRELSYLSEHYILLCKDTTVDLHLTQNVKYDEKNHVIQLFEAGQRDDLGTVIISFDTFFFMIIPDTDRPIFELSEKNNNNA